LNAIYGILYSNKVLNYKGDTKMDLTLNTEDQKLLKLIKKLCQEELDKKKLKEISDKVTYAKTVNEIRAMRPMLKPFLEKMEKIGLRSLPVPKKYGGLGGGFITMAVAAEALGYWMAPISEIWELAPMTWLVIGPNVNAGKDIIPDEQNDAFFKSFMKNPCAILAGTMSDATSGSDPQFPYEQGGAVLAVKEGNGWIINGDKGFSTGAPMCEGLSALTRTGEGHFAKSGTMFMVPPDAPGVSMTLNRLNAPSLIGNGRISYKNVRVTEENIIGKIGNGQVVLLSSLGVKYPIYCSLLGTMQKIYEDLREYAKKRSGGGKPIIEHSSVGERLGKMAIDLEMARAYALRVAWESDQRIKNNDPFDLYWSLGLIRTLKILCWQFCDLAEDIYGGIAGIQDLPIEGFMRMAWSMLPTGTTRMMQAIKVSKNYETRYNYMYKFMG
jgi:butyryl-CoA dehydrogenase